MTQVFKEDGKVIPVTIIKMVEAFEPELKDKDVTVIGTSKGKGYTGPIKKWNFAKQHVTRGSSDKIRTGGSIGAQTPGRVFKGKKMAGRHGNKRVTIKGLRIVDVNQTQNEVFVSGPIPGARNSQVILKVVG